MTVTSDNVPGMGTVRRLPAAAGDVTLGQAVDAYLATLGGAEQASTRRAYQALSPSRTGAGRTMAGQSGTASSSRLEGLVYAWLRVEARRPAPYPPITKEHRTVCH